jgi:predicted Fe-S protein YdhL (DUF1289 family)
VPLAPNEVAQAVTGIVKQLPRLVRWRKLTQEERREVLSALADATAQLALDCID